jgi:hypothetical protein
MKDDPMPTSGEPEVAIRATTTTQNEQDPHRLLRQIQDWRNGPEARMARYRNQVLYRRMQAPASLVFFVVCCFMVGVLLGEDADAKGLAITLMLTFASLGGGDAYELVRDAIENWFFCPRYDRASQDRPKVVIKEGLGGWRFFIYMAVMPLLPTLALWALNAHGLIYLPPQHGPWSVALGLSLFFGYFRVFKVPASLRKIFEPFKRIPSPDCN